MRFGCSQELMRTSVVSGSPQREGAVMNGTRGEVLGNPLFSGFFVEADVPVRPTAEAIVNRIRGVPPDRHPLAVDLSELRHAGNRPRQPVVAIGARGERHEGGDVGGGEGQNRSFITARFDAVHGDRPLIESPLIWIVAELHGDDSDLSVRRAIPQARGEFLGRAGGATLGVAVKAGGEVGFDVLDHLSGTT